MTKYRNLVGRKPVKSRQKGPSHKGVYKALRSCTHLIQLTTGELDWPRPQTTAVSETTNDENHKKSMLDSQAPLSRLARSNRVLSDALWELFVKLSPKFTAEVVWRLVDLDKYRCDLSAHGQRPQSSSRHTTYSDRMAQGTQRLSHQIGLVPLRIDLLLWRTALF